ncbi:unnamed protein product [Rotaria sp. Silwood1]|nr:unnamed protein product [Rotaria sp. Silwood1]
MSSSTIPNIVLEANNLNYIAMMFIRCFCFVVIPLGTVGHLMSIYVFTRPTLRSNSCSMYFLAASIVGLMHTCYILPMRMIQSAFIDTDPGAHSVIFCKITWLALNSLRGLGFWLIVLACGDRYLCSSASTNKRALSSVHVARRLIPVTILIGFIAYIHVPIFFKIDIIPATQKPICYPPGPPGTYRIVLSYFHLIYFGLSPSFCMLIFGMLTLRNIERSKRLAMAPSINLETAANQNLRKTNRHMLRMLFVQVLVYCITGLTFSVALIYTAIIANQQKNVFQSAQENMINAVVGMLSTTGPCLSFYLFTLSSGLFRKELKNLFCKFNRVTIQTQQVPTQQTNTDCHRCGFKIMHVSNYCGLILVIVTIRFVAPTKSSNGCGYAACNLGDPTKLNVHIVSHTHDDVGWLKTVDQYYYGSRNNIQHAGVQYILDSVICALDENADRRFIYVEIAFFWRWWNEQTDAMRNKVRGFVNDGRLEFISGGWCMNDEATTHYNSIIDQHSLGAEFLRDQFGECGRPKIGWQVDPFGHSREQGSLLAQMGFDGLFQGRVDYQDWQTRNRTKTMEMVWKTSTNLGNQSWLFTAILRDEYSPPDGLCFDDSCADPPIMDDPRLHDYNVPERVQAFIEASRKQAAGYATNHIISPMGADFHYENANEWFKNLDKLIKYVNLEQANGSDVNTFYSTPSCYLYALNKAGRTWTTKTDDFFPYADQPHGFWTGYFTSRPALKRYERHSNNILQITRQLNAFSNSQLRNSIFVLSEAMGVVQHHDAVSGTEKQEVAFDYAQRLSVGIDNAIRVINKAFGKLLPKDTQPAPGPQFLCQVTNVSECLPIQDQTRFTLTLWNPTVHLVLQHYRVPVTRSYTVRDPKGQLILTELIPVSDATKRIPGRTSTAGNQLIFRANLPALGFNTYFFEAKRYNITIGRRVWLRSSCTAIYVDNTWYSSDDNTLPLTGISYTSGFDPNLGDYRDFQLSYDLVRDGIHTTIVGHIRDWYGASGISFHLDTGDQIMTNIVPLDMDHVRTVFPSFCIEQMDQNDQRGYFTFEEEMSGDDGKHAGWWNSSSKVIRSGIQGGHVVLFNLTQQGEGDILVLSSFSQFMATSLSQTNNNILEFGVIGSMLSISANYIHAMMVFLCIKCKKALPIGNDSFWIDLFTQAHYWGLILYEQDWLDRQTIDFLPTRTDINLGRQWLISMGEAADKIGLNIQYCMSLPRHILSALQIPRVTQARTSPDYAVHLDGKGQQWTIGISSMFADANGLAPFRDVFWSTSLQPGSPYKPNAEEVLSEREILIATLSTRPVSPGDAINYTNAQHIMKCCREDGLILKPDRPLTMINRLVSDWAFHDGVSQGELYSTRTNM